jgi:hypothetical protein
MFIAFRPSEAIGSALFLAFWGFVVVHAALTQHPPGPHPTAVLWIGIALCGIAMLFFITAVAWIVRGMFIFFTAPWRR